MRGLMQRLVPMRESEVVPALLATGYGFLIFFAYYIIRPVRDEISAADRGNLQIIWTAVFLVMVLVAVPAYSAIVARWSRSRFIPFANRFFIACLLAFFAVLQLLPEGARPWIDRAFYVWSSVFALFVVTVYWGLIADLFNDDQGKRLFGFILVGSSLGGILGALATSQLADRVPVFTLLLLACVPLEGSAWMAQALHRRAQQSTNLRREPEGAPIGGTAWSGIRLVAQTPRLRLIALYLVAMTFVSTVLYFQQAEILGAAIADRGERRAFLARMDFWINTFTIVAQGLLVAHVIRLAGVGITLAIVPAIAAAGFLVLGLAPALTLFVIVQVLYTSLRHAFSKAGREVLFTQVSREARYKSKSFIDGGVYRGGDLISGWAYTGLAALGLGLATIALVAAPVAVAWAVLGVRMGRNADVER